MKTIITTAFLVLFSLNLNAQNEDLLSFQDQNPEIVFISQENFNLLSTEELQVLGENYILFDKNIELADIKNFDISLKTNFPINTKKYNKSLSDEDIQIKLWKKERIDVKIVKRSVFEASSIQNQNTYLESHCLILIGETLTLQDILSYPF